MGGPHISQAALQSSRVQAGQTEEAENSRLGRAAGGWWPGQTGRGRYSLSHLMGGLQHLHEKGVDGCVPNELEEEEVFQALEADGAQGRQAQQQLGKPAERRHEH